MLMVMMMMFIIIGVAYGQYIPRGSSTPVIK